MPCRIRSVSGAAVALEDAAEAAEQVLQTGAREATAGGPHNALFVVWGSLVRASHNPTLVLRVVPRLTSS